MYVFHSVYLFIRLTLSKGLSTFLGLSCSALTPEMSHIRILRIYVLCLI